MGPRPCSPGPAYGRAQHIPGTAATGGRRAANQRCMSWSSWFRRRDPVQQLEAEHLRLLQRARDQQRGGDIRGCAETTARAAELARRIDELRAAARPPGGGP